MPASAERLARITSWAEANTGHRFGDPQRLDRALTHSSARLKTSSNYERLEFLGDRVLGLAVADMLYAAFPQADEGELSLRFNQLVDATSLSAIAIETGLPPLIRGGADLGDPADKRHINVRADVVEALIASLYLDAGMEAARAFITRWWTPRLHAIVTPRRDPKTELQEWAHRDNSKPPVYVVASRDGPDHDPHFKVQLSCGTYPVEIGEGRSKRLAEQDAATRFLIKRGVWSAEEGKANNG